MKKILLSILIGGLLIATPVLAENGESGNSETPKSETVTLAREKRVTIKVQVQELKELRAQLRVKINEQKNLMKQYREQSQLTTEQREEVKSLIKSMKIVQEKLGAVYQNTVKVMQQYKKDSSTNKITGLDLVIASQQEKIALLKEAIAQLG